MSAPLTDDLLSWVGKFTGISVKPSLGADPKGGASPSGQAPSLSLSPDILNEALKQGLQDGVQHAAPKYKAGDGPLSDAYWQGYTGKVGPVGAPPLATTDQTVSGAYGQGMKDGIGHVPPNPPQDAKGKADYQKGYDVGWPPLTRLSATSSGPLATPGTGPSNAAANNAAKPSGDEDPETSVVADPAHKKPTDRKISMEVKYTIGLRATDESSPPNVQALPDMELTVGLDSPDKPPDIEAQLNVLKADITGMVKKKVNLKGKVKIEATVSLSAKMDTGAVGAGQIAAAVQTKIKAELELSILSTMSVKFGVDAGPGHKPEPGITVEGNLPKFLQF